MHAHVATYTCRHVYLLYKLELSAKSYVNILTVNQFDWVHSLNFPSYNPTHTHVTPHT